MRAKEIYKYTTGERVHRREMNREQPRRRGTRRGGASGVRAKSGRHQGWPYISRGPGGAPPSVPGAQRHRARRAHIVQVLWCEPQPYPIASTPPADPKCVRAALERTGEARKSNVALTHENNMKRCLTLSKTQQTKNWIVPKRWRMTNLGA